MRTVEESALLIALLFKRSEQKRARLSTATIRRLSGRKNIRRSFLCVLEGGLDDLGLILVELDRGGYGLIAASSLDGAPAITAKKYLPKEIRAKLTIDKIRAELGRETDAADDEDD
jgi:hypothetical protein